MLGSVPRWQRGWLLFFSFFLRGGGAWWLVPPCDMQDLPQPGMEAWSPNNWATREILTVPVNDAGVFWLEFCGLFTPISSLQMNGDLHLNKFHSHSSSSAPSYTFAVSSVFPCIYRCWMLFKAWNQVYSQISGDVGGGWGRFSASAILTFWAGRFYAVGVVLYMAGGLAVSLTSTHSMTTALPLVTATQNAQALSGVINNLILVNIL